MGKSVQKTIDDCSVDKVQKSLHFITFVSKTVNLAIKLFGPKMC